VTAVFRVVAPGLLTTVQDLGRPHATSSGVSPGGAMDRFAHAAANLLVGNQREAATLECTLRGPRLVAERDCLVAIAGADLDPRVNGAPAAMWTAVELKAEDELAFGSRRAGTRAYIAVAGGIVAERWLGSMSTDLLVGRGGMHGRPLTEGDVIEAAPPDATPATDRSLPEAMRPDYADHSLHAIAGPQAGRLTASSRQALFGETFSVSVDSNRMGYRLDGPPLEAPGDELLSFALVAGAVQLPSGGRPILLMADHQTAGGYPVVAVVVSASMPVAAQLAPGDELRFVETPMARALAMRAAQREALDSLRIWSM
jgi:antagonist of KipI